MNSRVFYTLIRLAVVCAALGLAAGCDDVHSPWRNCIILDGVVGGVGVDDDDACCLLSCCGAVTTPREGVERAEAGCPWPPSSMPVRLYTRQRDISV